MLHLRFARLLLIVFLTPALWADATARYKHDVKTALQGPEMQRALKSNPMLSSLVIRVRGNRAYSEIGKSSYIVDFLSNEITLLDLDSKTFATLPVKEYKEAMTSSVKELTDSMKPPEMPAAARKVMESMKSTFDSRKTGRTDVIQGVQAEEREMVLSIDSLNPAGAQQSGMGMKMVMQLWTAKPEESLRVPAVRELTAFNLWGAYAMNPADIMRGMAGAIPGFDKAFGAMMEEQLANKALMLRMRMAIYMPMMAAAAAQLEKQGMLAPDFDPNGPFVETSMELSELSTAPVDDSVFRVPEGYSAAPIKELLHNLMRAQMPGRPAPIQ
jgi:hypothetical protein